MKKSKLILLIIAVFAFMTALAVFASAADYCAVGEVKDGKAAILKADGTTAIVSFEGTAPQADTVCSYVNNGGTYTFTALSFPGYTSWRIYDAPGGAFYWDGGSTYVYYTSAPAFLKTGTYKWKVATTNPVVIPSGVGDYDNTGWPCNIDAIWNSETGQMDVLFGSEKVYNADNGYASALDPKVVMCPNAAEKELRITEKVDHKVCAVGEIDAASKKAAVLFKDGSIETVDYEGDVTADTVCTFTVSGGKYTFTPVTFAGYLGWRIYDVNAGSIYYGHDGTNEYRVSYDGSVAFLKTGTNKWKVAKANQVVIPDGVGDYPNTGWWANVDAVDLDGDGVLDVLYSDGNKAGDGLDPKVVLAPNSGEYDVVLGNEQAPQTADIISVIAIVALMSLSGAALLIGKKH